MRILISAIGKLKKKTPEQELIDDYIRKTRWPVHIRESEEKKALSGEPLKEAEGKLLLDTVPSGARIVVLDERGVQLGSREFAQKLESWQDLGCSDVAFLIGGADGHSETTRKKADLLLSFGKMTMPHMLVRVVLAEQIYRAKTIIDGHPYHRD